MKIRIKFNFPKFFVLIKRDLRLNRKGLDQDSVVGSVIQASGMVTFEDVLMTDAATADIWLASSIRTNPVVNLVAQQPFDPGGPPSLGKTSVESYLSDRDGPNVQRQLRATPEVISDTRVLWC